jgi:hypothetical protein
MAQPLQSRSTALRCIGFALVARRLAPGAARLLTLAMLLPLPLPSSPHAHNPPSPPFVLRFVDPMFKFVDDALSKGNPPPPPPPPPSLPPIFTLPAGTLTLPPSHDAVLSLVGQAACSCTVSQVPPLPSSLLPPPIAAHKSRRRASGRQHWYPASTPRANRTPLLSNAALHSP